MSSNGEIKLYRRNFRNMNNQNLDTKQITDVQKKAEDAILNNFLNDINSLCLLDTGLGKTRIACEVLNALLFEIKKNNSYALIFYNQKDGLDSSWEKELKQLNLEYEVLSGKNFNDFILTSEEDKFFPHKEKIFLLSYELLKWAGRSDNWLVKILSMPGLYLQKLTTSDTTMTLRYQLKDSSGTVYASGTGG